VHCDGRIAADGGSGYGIGGAGSGGSVLLLADTLTGLGRISADGGVGLAGGGGGRVAVYVGDLIAITPDRLTAKAGVQTSTQLPGKPYAGTVVVCAASADSGLRIVNNAPVSVIRPELEIFDGGRVTASNTWLRVSGTHHFTRVRVDGGSLTLSGDMIIDTLEVVNADLSMDGECVIAQDMTVLGGQWTQVHVQGSLDVGRDLLIRAYWIDADARLTVGRDFSLEAYAGALLSDTCTVGRDMVVDNAPHVELQAALQVGRDLNLLDATLYCPAATVAGPTPLDIVVGGTLAVEGTVSATGGGYVGDLFTQAQWRGARTFGNALVDLSSASGAAGGTHGGVGGLEGYEVSVGGAYGDLALPTEAGSGGGAEPRRQWRRLRHVPGGQCPH
jgi:hypothetical protein